MTRAPDFFEQFGWPSETSPDHEADDLLGSLAAAETAAGGEALLLTGDRDMYQCVGDGVIVLYLRAGNVEEIDPAEVKRRYGISPALVPDFIALAGIPRRVAGGGRIGPKTAAELLTRHGSLEGAIAAAQTERPRVARALTEQADELRAFRRIAQLQMVEIERPVDRATDLEGGARAARGLGLNRLAERLEEADDVTRL